MGFNVIETKHQFNLPNYRFNLTTMALVPENYVGNTQFMYLHHTSVKSQLIYTATLLLFSLISLPFLYITVSTQSFGSVQSEIEKIDIISPIDGNLININLKDNQRVTKGTTLFSVDAALPKQQENLLAKKSIQLQQYLVDVRMLLTLNHSVHPKTALYFASWQQYVAQLKNNKLKIDQYKRMLERHTNLFNKRVITLLEFEQHNFNYEQAIADEQLIKKDFKNKWQISANQYEDEMRTLQSQLFQLHEQQKHYELKATINGFVQNLVGLQVGNTIYANQKIAEISPDSALFAYCYVKPSAIGLIKKGQVVRFQIHSFNYNQWGLIIGKVVDISEDTNIINANVFFKVKCQLQKDFLKLKNGYKGQIKKGMTFTANFTVAKRSLYQLLNDKIEDWFNSTPQKA